ncbi:MAG TPA: hypothetical protein VI141_03810 [Acidimicrobiia bacterium]
MGPERDEVYERIPWETLERKGGDRQWLVYAVAGAVTLGALAYSFTRNQPATVPVTAGVAMETTTPGSGQGAAVPVPAGDTQSPPVATIADSTATTSAGPMVVAEADLFALEPERLIDRVSAHAEWLAVEYVAYDGTEESRQTLAALLPTGSPLPEASEGTQVFVDWVGVTEITQTGALSYEVEVLVRSLTSSTDAGFSRLPARLLLMEVVLDEEGEPGLASLPATSAMTFADPVEMSLVDVPADLAVPIGPGDRVLGGRQSTDGSWEVMVMHPGSDGVTRPVRVPVP